ncbi:hypothetical protein RFI_04690 [Reticulomyxa filosa]|uniref:Kelch motif family protein n=1 Tax=Reticulomyxa filosa TaxID=46433 RepID=X6P2X9_RETFI|nr:hypothetical protein RFI_04690 [Reticulomyxa filosa]|eukprot:ETO32429.1 hypothetical protein RFI_04690 [Reticulomyxa filosa]
MLQISKQFNILAFSGYHQTILNCLFYNNANSCFQTPNITNKFKNETMQMTKWASFAIIKAFYTYYRTFLTLTIWLVKLQLKNLKNKLILQLPFKTLKELTIKLYQAQRVPHKHEILICGGAHERALNNNNKDSNEITLLSFGSAYDGEVKHTLIMKYVSIWRNENEMNKSKELKKSNNYNQWVSFTDNHNTPIIIGRGVIIIVDGAVIENRQEQEMVKTNEEKNTKRNYEMLLFCENAGLLIEYNEDDNIFQFHRLPVRGNIVAFNNYAYVCINDIILFFGGSHYRFDCVISNLVHKYSIKKKWMTFRNTLPSPLFHSVAILSEDNTNIHTIGGSDYNNIALSTNIKTKVRIWDTSQLSKNEIKFIIQHWTRNLMIKLVWIDDLDQIIFEYSKIK